MGGHNNGPSFQQWVGSYTCETKYNGGFFSPLELSSDGTLTIGGQEVEYYFNPDDSTISLKEFTLTKGNTTLTAPQAQISFSYENAQAVFKGNIQSNPASGLQEYWGKQPTREMVIPGFISDAKMSMALYNDELHVIGAAKYDIYRSHLLVHRAFPLNRLIPEDGLEADWTGANLNNPKHWSKELYQPEYWDKFMGGLFNSKIVPYLGGMNDKPDRWASSPRDEYGDTTSADITSLVPISQALYLFFTYSNTACMCLRARKFVAEKGKKGGKWGEEIVLYEPQDDSREDKALLHTGTVAAVPFGQEQILVVACGTGDERVGGTDGPGW